MSKPTPEFVTWYMLPEQKEFRAEVNKRWKPEEGDWLLEIVGDEKYLQLVSPPPADFTLDDVRDKVFPLLWLPSLSDLLRMVEAAVKALPHTVEGQPAGFSFAYDCEPTEQNWIAWVTEKVYGEEIFGSNYKNEPEIAAAELLRRLWGVG